MGNEQQISLQFIEFMTNSRIYFRLQKKSAKTCLFECKNDEISNEIRLSSCLR